MVAWLQERNGIVQECDRGKYDKIQSSMRRMRTRIALSSQAFGDPLPIIIYYLTIPFNCCNHQRVSPLTNMMSVLFRHLPITWGFGGITWPWAITPNLNGYVLNIMFFYLKFSGHLNLSFLFLKYWKDCILRLKGISGNRSSSTINTSNSG